MFSFSGPVKCVTLLEEEYHVVSDSFWKQLSGLLKILCEWYVVKIWEGMVQNLLSCDTSPKRWEYVCFSVPFPSYTISNIVHLKILPHKNETHDIYICIRSICGKTLVGRDQIGMELFQTSSQPMKKLDFGK